MPTTTAIRGDVVRRHLLIGVVVMSSLLAACSPSTSPVADTTPQAATLFEPARSSIPVSEAVARAVREAAAKGLLVRWPDELVTVSLEGSPTPRDIEILDDGFAAIGLATGLDLELVDDDDADVTVLFAPRAEWPDELQADLDHVFGVTLTDRTEGEITRARVAIDSTIGQGSRNLTILHELLHVVGLGHVECPTSAVTGDIGGSPIWTLSGLDEQLLTTWYSPGMPTGSPLADIEAALVVVPGGPECEVQVVEGVETPVGTIWCSLGGEGARSCVEVDGTDPPPEVPIVLPDRWIRSGVVYDHDPDLYEVVVFDGRRLLCALGSEPRRPCQFTDGPGPITSPDVWTDGSVIYDTP